MGPLHSVMVRRAVGAALIAIGAFLGRAAAGQVIDRRLSIEQSGANQYTISWDAFLTQGFGLRSAGGLIMPTWQNVAITPTTVGSRREVVLMATSPTFFRLDCMADGNQDSPDENFIDNDCDGVDGNIGLSVFVSTTTGNDANPGTPQQPVATITRAIAVSGNTGRNFILVAAGDYAEPTITVPDFRFIHGGYSASDWSRSASNISRILSTSPTAMVIPQNSGAPVFLDRLTIVAANAPAGQSSYGVLVLPNANGFVISLNMRRCTVQAGTGGNGTNGSAASPPGNTTAGGPGEGGCGYLGECMLSCDLPTPGSGGNGCNNGGAGGAPGGTQGSAGQGGGGSPPPPCSQPGCGGAGESQFGAGAGRDGANGAAGSNGAAGNAGGSYGFFGWSVVNGETGIAGTAGGGGGGGGGGKGGGDVSCTYYGGAGGGGGGGCGGPGGGGGGSGGSSFAIYIAQARAIIEQSTLIGGNGGNGGTGATGATGAVGSAGDSGGAGVGGSGNGALGGRGGNGGTGGHGGGGAGGASIGLAYGLNSQVFGTNTYMTGSGGAGGASPGNSGPAGGSAQVVTF